MFQNAFMGNNLKPNKYCPGMRQPDVEIQSLYCEARTFNVHEWACKDIPSGISIYYPTNASKAERI